MAFIQRILPDGSCEHDNCTVIDCVTTDHVTHHETGSIIHAAGSVVWHSHMDAGIHPEHRLNPDHPAEDHRTAEVVPVTKTEFCAACMVHPEVTGWVFS